MYEALLCCNKESSGSDKPTLTGERCTVHHPTLLPMRCPQDPRPQCMPAQRIVPETETPFMNTPAPSSPSHLLMHPLSASHCPPISLPPHLTALCLQDVEAVFFENASPDNTWTTVGGRFRSCSHGQSLLTRANSVVAPVLKIPCSGTTPRGTPYSTSDCTALDYRGFQEAGLEAAKAAGISVQLYKYISVLLPPGNTCNFIGTGNLGCPGSCGTWIQGTAVMGNARAAPRNTHHVLHEMGRNLVRAGR